MSKRNKKNQMQDIPIDRMESFLQQNYKKILIAIASVISVSLIAYATTQWLNMQNNKKVDTIASVEQAGFINSENLDRYLSLAKNASFAKDYIYVNAAEYLVTTGNKDRAVETLGLAGGEYLELSKSLLFDLKGGTVEASYLDKGNFSPLWYYRAILAADESKRGDLVNRFKISHPDSKLLQLIENWGI